jgi:hypothetical protein
MPSLQDILNNGSANVSPTIAPRGPVVKKLLILLPFYNGDRDQMIELCEFLADLEPEKTKLADIALYARNDAQFIDEGVVFRLSKRFGKVHQFRCRRMNAVGYPYGPNEMFYDVIEKFRAEEWQKNYHAFFNMECDCIPLAVDWIKQLDAAFRAAAASETVFAIGHINNGNGTLVRHLNGAAVYSMKFWENAGRNDILGGSGSVAYDIFHADKIMPIASDTPLIMLDWKRKTITQQQLFEARKEGFAPVIYHGVKDESALKAARAQLLDKPIVIQTAARFNLINKTKVYTYYAKVDELVDQKQHEMLEIWKQSWSAHGWEPVVIGPRDAEEHPWHSFIQSLFAGFPTTNPKAYELACWMRWVAMSLCGGMMVDYDVLNFGFTPDMLPANPGNYASILADNNPCPCAVHGTSKQYDNTARLFLEHKPVEGQHISDQNLIQQEAAKFRPYIFDLCPEYTAKGWKTAKMVHFSHGSCHGKDRLEIMRNAKSLRLEVA